VGFVVDKVEVEPGFLRVLRFSHVRIILPELLAHLFIYQRRFSISATDSGDTKQQQIKDYRNVNITVFFLMTQACTSSPLPEGKPSEVKGKHMFCKLCNRQRM
jgi:hypothetical protein